MNYLLKSNPITVNIAQKIICKNLQLEINPGDRWGLLGPNGSGKTTLLHTLAGLHSVTQGEILLREKKLTSLSRKTIARQIGILFQDTPFVFPQSVYEFCSSGRYPHQNNLIENKKIIDQALLDMELDKIKMQKVQTLSGGEKRRLAIATILAQTPQIYLLDEPMNHLDLRHQIRVIQHFKQLSEIHSVGIVMAIHDLNIAQHFCNRILMLFSNGKTLQGETAEMLTDENVSELYQHPIKSQQSSWIPCF